MSHYERLEFLGDAVLDLVISEWLMEKHPDENEGVLSRMRSELVNRDTLAEMARFVGLDQHLRLGRGETLNGGRAKVSILGDVFEAVVGAIYLDAGFNASQRWVLGHYERFLASTFNPLKVRDHKSALQEWTQSHGLQLPDYKLVKEEGPDHEKQFHVRCELLSGVFGEGCGATKKQAEQTAASDVLKKLETS